jgi:hypothetical protein
MTMRDCYEFTRGLDYSSIVATSEKVAWTVAEVFDGRRFDAARPIVPDSWLGAEALALVDDRQRLVLNHCRAFSYVHILGNFEEFAAPHLLDVASQDWHAARPNVRALLRFGDEEAKHQELFLRAERVLEESCGHLFARYFDTGKTRVAALARAVMQHSALARFLIVLALEWGTQRHYVESIRERADALYADLLKAHWVEEAQHTKVDVLEIARLAATMSSEAVAAVFDEVIALGGVVEPAFVGQAANEVETVERVTGRTFSEAEREALSRALHHSLRGTMADIGLTHPSFAQLACALSIDGAAKLGLVPNSR